VRGAAGGKRARIARHCAPAYAASMLCQRATTLAFETRGRGLLEITRPVVDWADASGFASGLLTLFIRHTSASLVIQENADPKVCRDLEAFLSRLVPEGDPLYTHNDEGEDDMPSHVKAAVTRTSETIPIRKGELRLGAWQGIFVWDHRHARHRREIEVVVQGA
jgi:secondary thiamine-phosphate synthase enzyme